MRRVPSIAGVVFLAYPTIACSFDSGGAPAGPDSDAATSGADAAGSPFDAGPPPDAPVEVECSSAADCQDPPPCRRAGVCNLTLGICQFSPVDCSSMDDACNVGVCNPADDSCERTPAFEGETCADPDVGDYGGCMFAGACDLTGMRSRDRTDYVCSAGTCSPMSSTETDTCTRPGGDVVGDPCGSDTCGPCGMCMGFSSTCDESGECDRTCTKHQCNSSGACLAMTYSVTESCTRDTQGHSCSGCGEPPCECDRGGCADSD